MNKYQWISLKDRSEKITSLFLLCVTLDGRIVSNFV